MSTKPNLGNLPSGHSCGPLKKARPSLLFTIVTTSYQTTCTVSERTPIKGTCQSNLHGVVLTRLRQNAHHLKTSAIDVKFDKFVHSTSNFTVIIVIPLNKRKTTFQKQKSIANARLSVNQPFVRILLRELVSQLNLL